MTNLVRFEPLFTEPFDDLFRRMLKPVRWDFEGLPRDIKVDVRETDTGYTVKADLPLWYAGADVLAYPSLAEGFGLPALEAMACGTPVVTSDCSALPEVVGDAAITAPPESVRAIADALTRTLTDKALAAEMSGKGLERSKMFDWERTAAETVAVYREAESA